jgi:hypothetical protein
VCACVGGGITNLAHHHVDGHVRCIVVMVIEPPVENRAVVGRELSNLRNLNIRSVGHADFMGAKGEVEARNDVLRTASVDKLAHEVASWHSAALGNRVVGEPGISGGGGGCVCVCVCVCWW